MPSQTRFFPVWVSQSIVGNNQISYRGLIETIKLDNSIELGALLFRAAELATQSPWMKRQNDQ